VIVIATLVIMRSISFRAFNSFKVSKIQMPNKHRFACPMMNFLKYNEIILL
jgi:hypothetical protein